MALEFRFSGRAEGSAPARRSARTIHARPSHAAYVRRVCGPSRPTSRTASHAYPRRSTSRKSSRASSERRTRPNSFGELSSTHVRKCSISDAVMGRRAAPVWTRNSARRRSLLRKRSRGGIATPGTTRHRESEGAGASKPRETTRSSPPRLPPPRRARTHPLHHRSRPAPRRAMNPRAGGMRNASHRSRRNEIFFAAAVLIGIGRRPSLC